MGILNEDDEIFILSAGWFPSLTIEVHHFAYYDTKGVARGGKGGNPPPPKPKYCCRKMVLFPKALFLVTNFRKKNKI